MTLQFVGIDPATNGDHCPTVWVDADAGEIVVQGWKVDDGMREDCLKTGSIPADETVVRLPARMASILREACDVVADVR